MMKPITIRLAGVKFDNCQENIKLYSYPSFNIYQVTRENNNPHDPNAVRIGIGNCELGYLPRHVAQVVAPLIDTGSSFMAEHVALNECPPHETVGLTVKIIETTK